VDYDSTDLEKLSLYARHLYPLLRESTPEDDPIADFGRIVFDLLVAQMKDGQLDKGPPSSQRR
jgi:type I restriction enzyme R subunit